MREPQTCGVPARRTLPRRTRGTLLPALAAVLALSACGGGDPVAAASAPAAAGTSSSPVPGLSPAPSLPPDALTPPSATPTPSLAPPQPTGERTAAQLAGQLVFTAPASTDPLVTAGVAAYRDFMVQFLVAQGLPQAEYPPLVARVDPSLQKAGLQPLRDNDAAGKVLLGRWTETVKAAAGSNDAVYLSSCADASDRKIYLRSTGAFVEPVQPALVGLKVTMRRPADQWVLAGYQKADDVECP